MRRPSIDLATALSTLLGDFALGTNIFAGPERPKSASIPSRALFVVPIGGAAKQRTFRGGGVRSPSMQIRVRGEAGDFDGAETDARTVWTAVDDMVTDSGELVEYISALASNSEPIFVGKDDQERFVFTVNVEMKYVGN